MSVETSIAALQETLVGGILKKRGGLLCIQAIRRRKPDLEIAEVCSVFVIYLGSNFQDGSEIVKRYVILCCRGRG